MTTNQVRRLAMALLAARRTLEMYFPERVSWSLTSTLSMRSARISFFSIASMRLTSTELSLSERVATCGWWPSHQCGCTPRPHPLHHHSVLVWWNRAGECAEQQVFYSEWRPLSSDLWWLFCWNLKSLEQWCLCAMSCTVRSAQSEFNLFLFRREKEEGIVNYLFCCLREQFISNHIFQLINKIDEINKLWYWFWRI